MISSLNLLFSFVGFTMFRGISSTYDILYPYHTFDYSMCGMWYYHDHDLILIPFCTIVNSVYNKMNYLLQSGSVAIDNSYAWILFKLLPVLLRRNLSHRFNGFTYICQVT